VKFIQEHIKLQHNNLLILIECINGDRITFLQEHLDGYCLSRIAMSGTV